MGRGARGPTRAGPRSPGHAAVQRPRGLPLTPGARAGSGPPRGPPALPQRTHPGTGARAPGRPGAPASRTAPRRPSPREPSLCRQPDKAPARGCLTASRRRAPLSHVAGHPPLHTDTCPHTHTSPHPPAGPGANPQLPGPSRSDALKVTTVLHRRVTWRVPNRPGGPGGGQGVGATPPAGRLRVGPTGLGLGQAPRPAPPRPAGSGANRPPRPARLAAARRPSRGPTQRPAARPGLLARPRPCRVCGWRAPRSRAGAPGVPASEPGAGTRVRFSGTEGPLPVAAHLTRRGWLGRELPVGLPELRNPKLLEQVGCDFAPLRVSSLALYPGVLESPSST